MASFESVGPRLRDRLGLLRAALVQTALGVAQPALPALPGGQLGRQLVAARITEALILLGVDRGRVVENLARDVLVAARRAFEGVGMHLRPVDGDHPDTNKTGLRAKREHLPEQLRKGPLVALAEARDRRVIRALVRADHPRGDVLDAAALDASRRPFPERVAVKHSATIIAGSCAARP